MVSSGSDWAALGSNSVESRPILADAGPIWPNSGQIWQDSGKFGRFRPQSGRMWLMPNQSWTIQVSTKPSNICDQISPRLSAFRSILGQIWPDVLDLGPAGDQPPKGPRNSALAKTATREQSQVVCPGVFVGGSEEPRRTRSKVVAKRSGNEAHRQVSRSSVWGSFFVLVFSPVGIFQGPTSGMRICVVVHHTRFHPTER